MGTLSDMTTALAPVTAARPPALSVPAARRLSCAGALWAFGFAALHLYWAADGRLGVPADVPSIWQRPGFLAYDLVAALALVTAGVIGLVLAVPTGGGRRRLFLVDLAVVGAVAALLRGGFGLLQTVVTLPSGGQLSWTSSAFDAWFVVAGAVFLVAGLKLRATARVVSAYRR